MFRLNKVYGAHAWRAALAFCTVLGLSQTGSAQAGEGSPCGRFMQWSQPCAPGFECKPFLRLDAWELGTCVQEAPASCGGQDDLQCAEGQFCNYAHEAASGVDDVTGTCAECDPNMTCLQALTCVDGKEYPTRCGPDNCDEPIRDCPAECGDPDGLPCAEGQFCNYALEAACGLDDMTGTCETLPTLCTTDYEPVCGCDGKTYSNTCIANTKGVSVEHEGGCHECEPSADSCEVDGVTYELGERFPTPDGCNECTCGEDGHVACTERACLCDYNDGRDWKGRDKDVCSRIRFSCEKGQRYFSDECGCGCEPDPTDCRISGCDEGTCTDVGFATRCTSEGEAS